MLEEEQRPDFIMHNPCALIQCPKCQKVVSYDDIHYNYSTRYALLWHGECKGKFVSEIDHDETFVSRELVTDKVIVSSIMQQITKELYDSDAPILVFKLRLFRVVKINEYPGYSSDDEVSVDTDVSTSSISCNCYEFSEQHSKLEEDYFELEYINSYTGEVERISITAD